MSSYLTYLLAESRSDFILKNKDNIDKIYNVLVKQTKTKNKDKEQVVKDFLTELEQNKYISKYLNWVVKQYINGRWIYPEDVSRIENDLNKFYRSLVYLKNNNLNTDLNKYNMESFNQLMLDLPETNRQEDINIKNNEAKQIYEDSDFRIIVPKTENAAILYGKGTKWCTAATESKNRFNYYNEKGPLYILINKTDPSEKYQFHFETKSFMNKLDIKISLKNFLKKYPKIKDFFKNLKHPNKNNYKNWVWYNPEDINYKKGLEVVSKDPSSIKYIPEDILKEYNLYLKAIERDGFYLSYVPDNLKDYNLCLIAMKNAGNLYFVPYKFKDYNLCLEAVKNDGWNLKYVPKRYKERIKKELNL